MEADRFKTNATERSDRQDTVSQFYGKRVDFQFDSGINSKSRQSTDQLSHNRQNSEEQGSGKDMTYRGWINKQSDMSCIPLKTFPNLSKDNLRAYGMVPSAISSKSRP